MVNRFLFWILFSFVSFNAAYAQSQDAYVILVSLDGYRWDYTERFKPENIQRLIDDGVEAAGLLPAFPSKTFPNHYSIATGMLPEFHGLVNNTIRDPKKDMQYAISKREAVQDPFWYGGTPLWVLAEQAGLKTASYFFVGTEAPVKGIQPTYFYNYDAQVSNLTRISKVFEWLQLPDEERPRLITLYFSDMDDIGHRHGPDNDAKLRPAIEKLDRELGALMEGLKSFDLPIHLVLVSDHGMASVPKQNLLSLDEITKGIQGEVINNGALAHVFLEDRQMLESTQRVLASRGDHFRVVKPDDTGYYSANSPYANRLGDLLVVPELGYYLATAADRVRYQNRSALFVTDTFGEHGYSPSYPEMQGIFYAWGPFFRRGIQIPSFRNVHVYPLVCDLLGLQVPEEVQGDFAVLQPILIKDDADKKATSE
ncbi:Alkaline phosphodiesterase I [Lunatimonas lonarensis]|uniref:Alkaline phosphodiesterase I n=1 Tax=Lunatimonas lonarensis TaxID=1232681 RepID=R7ZL48_9BACT|nr:ectonucleotide pyrophosphatase/phosphodiesterase [Lunatimonas lonarensis]EON74797.1 Alkaline phosphodiesterase I [Lunatimonas lonarensis]